MAVGAVTVLKTHFDWIGRDAPVAVYLGAIMFSAWLGGVGPGLLATALSCLSGAYFFAAPYGSLEVASPGEAARLAIGGAEGAFISVVAGALRRANEELRKEVRERLRAEAAVRRATDQMVHAQKMRAVGDFAGGVAHDFNNMLGVMFACLDLLDLELASDHAGRDVAQELRAVVDRAAAVARQLTTFARRQDARPAPVHLHEALARVEPIVTRVVGPSVRVELLLGATSVRVVADLAQLEQAIVNLAANGRDAMPEGGTLTISTADASPDSCRALAHRPGSHVEIAVRDTGMGMDEETKARVFEPFFSTKAAGAGTGLGLSMVFATVERLGGAITVESEPGKGATFRMLLPVTDRTPADSTRPQGALPETPPEPGRAIV